MSLQFYNLTVKNVHPETADSVSIVFDVPDVAQQQFKFAAGQNLTLKTTINGQELRRNYSLCSAPVEGILKIGVKKVEGGLFSNYALTQLKQGDTLEVMPPAGRFGLKQTSGNNFLAIAAGSGITPILSIITQTLRTNATATFTLFYGNKNRGSIMFFNELEALKNQYMQRFACFHILSREATAMPLQQGRITAQRLQQFENFVNFSAFNEALICGPAQMIEEAAGFLQQAGMPKQAIHFELFTTPGNAANVQKTAPQQQVLNTGATSEVHIKLDGRTTVFTMPQQGQNVLDAAMAQGLDLPFACKGGVCCTCRAKLITGHVQMAVNYALEPEEVAAGFILTCQSHPTTAQVTIDFDTR